MERDQSADVPFAAAELTARAFGKGHRTDKAVQDELMGRAGRSRELAGGVVQRVRKRAGVKRYLAARKRRYEFGNRPGPRPAPKTTCPHMEQRWTQVPHPKYGNAQPFFTSHLVAVTGDHDCVYGAI